MMQFQDVVIPLGPELDTKEDTDEHGFEIYWDNLTYFIDSWSLKNHIVNVANKTIPDSYQRVILSNICGMCESGTITALMGPSGAGKTTFLECLVGKRRHGLSGEIRIRPKGLGYKAEPVDCCSLALIPQYDLFFERLTVMETIVFSSKCKNSDDPTADHHAIARELITKLDLEGCAKDTIKSLSGSEQKRVSIACDLVSRPNILVLDEPTTGLDSFAANIIVDLLLKLAVDYNLCVLLTIHQPSWTLLKKCTKVYMLSPVVKRCIFDDIPSNIEYQMKLKDIVMEPTDNPGDTLTELAASGSVDMLTKMSCDQEEKFQFQNKSRSINLQYSLENGIKGKFSFRLIVILVQRFIKGLVRDGVLFWFALTSTVLLSYMIVSLFGASGVESGCPPLVSESISVSSYTQLTSLVKKMGKTTWKNQGLIFMTIFTSGIFVMLPSLFLVPMELRTMWKEVKNDYYTVETAFVAKLIADIIIAFFFSGINSGLTYYISRQPSIMGPKGFTRLFLFFLSCFGISLASQSIALIVASILWMSPMSTIFMGSILYMPQLLFSGFLSGLTTNPIPRFLSLIDPMRWAVSLAHVSVYGFDRCGVDEDQSRLQSMKASIEMMSTEVIKLVSSEGYTIFSEDNSGFDLSGMKSKLQEQVGGLVQTLIASVFMYFYNPQMETKSIPMNLMQLSDTEVTKFIFFLFLLNVVYRGMAYLHFKKRLKELN